MSNLSTYERFGPSLNMGSKEIMSLDDVARASELASRHTIASLDEWLAEEGRIRTLELDNGRQFRMLVDVPEIGDPDKLFLVGSEYANAFTPRNAGRVKAIRDLVAPEATLVWQANAGDGQDNLNFSPVERKEVCDGNLESVLGRIWTTLNTLRGSSDNPFPHQIAWGPSQAGAVVLPYAAHPDTPAAAVALVEAPNVGIVNNTTGELRDRSRTELAIAFARSGSQLGEVFQSNLDDPDTQFAAELRAQMADPMGLPKFARDCLHRNNRPFLSGMRRATALSHIQDINRKGGALVDATGTVDSVSLLASHEHIATMLDGSSLFASHVIDAADHSVTNSYAVNAALLREAVDLRR